VTDVVHGRPTSLLIRAARSWYLNGATRVWSLTAVLAGASVAVLLTAARSVTAPLTGVHVEWWMLAVGFAVAEVFVLHVRIARDAHSFSLSEIPLVIGLAFSTPTTIVLAQALGVGVALTLHRRQKPIRCAFNVAQRSVTALGAAFVFVTTLRLAGTAWPAVWVAAFGATLTADVVAGVLIDAAIALSEGVRIRFTEVLGIGTALTFANTGLALLAVMALIEHPAALLLVAFPAAATFLAGRAYLEVQRKHDDVVVLQRATGLAQRSLDPDEMLPTLLEHLREMFHADIAELLLPHETGEHHLVSRVGPGDAVAILTPIVPDPVRGVWARVAAEREGVLLARPIRNLQLAEHFGSLGIVDAIVAPVTSDEGPVGILTVANRVGDFSTFAMEDLRLLDALANHIGVAIRNARLMRRVEEALAHETEMSKLKDDFLATISHELRTPLTSIQGYVKTLLAAGAGLSKGEREEFLAGADRAVDRLRSLIEDLLFTSRVESSTVRNRLGPVGVAGLIQRVAEERLERLVPGRIVLRIPPSVPLVWTSEEDVGRVLSNLLDNALKYSPADTSVTVSAAADGTGVRISFHDHGVGIPELERERIFERFYQVDQGLTRSVGGAGLGLYVCRRTAEHLGGRVWLEQSDDSGSVFCLWLPTTPPADAEEPVSVPDVIVTA
jgi:signal transduction histidine kinase